MEEVKELDKDEKSGKKEGKVGKGRPPKHTQFKPGQSGNPAGKPVGTLSLTAIIKKKLNEIYDSPTNKEAKKVAIDILAEQIIKNGIDNGSERTQEKIWAYLDGHPKQTVDIGADKESLAELTTMFRAMAKKKK